VIAALLKRLTHRNANVQLYALSVAEALSKNCDGTVHREMASKAFTQGLEKLATDRVRFASFCAALAVAVRGLR
jgi:signal transducing adaptor molecule